jgi:zinc protease
LLHSVYDTILDNGLKVILLRKPGAPIVAVQVWYKTGSINECDGIRGISHFFEHMMFRGSKNVDSEEHARRINDVGGHCNAFTAEDITAYLNSVPSRYMDMVLSLEADRMQNLSITGDILNTERNVIIEEYQGYMNNPLTKAFLEFRSVFYDKHPYATGPLGFIEDIKKITVDDCKKYYQTWYRPDNAIAVIVGDFENNATVIDKVNSTLGAVPRTDSNTVVQSHNVNLKSSLHENRMTRCVEFDVPFLILGYPAPPANHRDALRLEILQSIISQGETGRMHRELVRKRSMAVMVGGINQCLKWSGMSLFFAVFTPDVSVHRVEKALVKQLELIKKGVTPEEIDKIRNSTLTNRILDLYSAEQICQRLGYSETVEGDYHGWVERLDALEHLDCGELAAAAEKYWNESNRHTLYLKPRRINPLYFCAGLFRRIFVKKGG